LGQNAPKRGIKCTKTQGEMHQNAGQNAPKRKAKSTKMQGKKQQNSKPVARICSVQKGLKAFRRTEITCKKGQNST